MVQFLGSNFVKKADRTPKGTPQTLYKRANLKLHRKTGEILIVPLVHQAEGVGVNADAVCGAGFSHAAPRRGCRCGFYAYTSYDDAESHCQGGDVILKVVASGEMFQYRQGYRYGHQRLEQVEVRKCHWCPESAYRFALTFHNDVLLPMCRSHASNTAMKTLSFPQVEEFASAELPSHAPRITVKAETYESFPNTLKHFATTNMMRRIVIVGAGAGLGVLANRAFR